MCELELFGKVRRTDYHYLKLMYLLQSQINTLYNSTQAWQKSKMILHHAPKNSVSFAEQNHTLHILRQFLDQMRQYAPDIR